MFTPRWINCPRRPGSLYTYNPEKAKKLLAEAGYPNGFTFKAQISNASQTGLDLAAMVVAYLAKIGVKLELEPMDYPSYLSRMTKKNHSEGYFFSNDHGDPFAGIRKNFLTGQTWNPHMMSDPYVDKTWQEAVENPKLTDKQALEVMKKLAVYVMEQAPCIILPTPYTYTAWWPWVKNYYGEITGGCPASRPDHCPHLDRSGNEEEDGILKKIGSRVRGFKGSSERCGIKPFYP